MPDSAAPYVPESSGRAVPNGLILVAGLLVLSIVVAATVHFDRRNVLRTATARADALSEIAIAHVDQVLAAIDFNIRALESDPDSPGNIELVPRELLRQKLRLIQVGSRALLGIGYIDAAGWLVAGSALQVTDPVNLADRPFFRAVRWGQSRDLVLSPPARASTTGEIGIPISRMIRNKDGSFGGVVSGRLDTAYFERFFRALGADAVAIALLDGTIVARFPEIDLLTAPMLPVGELARRTVPGTRMEPFFFNSPVDGVERLISLNRIAAAPVYVEVAFDRDRLLADWARRRDMIVAGAGIIALLAAAVAMLAHRRARDFAAKLRAEARAAAEAEAREAAVEASRRKSEFLAHMSHEIRTPLNAIIGFSQMISGQMLGPVGHARYRDYAADILYSAEHLLSVINNVLDLSKVEAGKWSIDSDHVPVGELVDATCRLATARAAHENVRIDVAPIPPLSVFGDKRTLLQVLLNLTINAIKFAGDDRSVTVACTRTADGGAEFTVVDRGPGMTPDDIARALRPFETASSVQARQRQDTGLGLPLARVFAELHDGRLTLDSAPERGTIARFWLPAARVRALPA